MTTPGRPISARDLNAAESSARTAHPATGSFLAVDNGSSLALRNPRRGSVPGRLVPAFLDTDSSPGNPPGESVDRYQETPTNPDPNAPIQLRQFHDMTDTLAVQEPSSTGDNPTAADVQLLVRHGAGPGAGTGRPRLEYVDGDGLFWLTGGDATTCHGVAIRIDSAQTDASGHPLASVTITVSLSAS